MHNINNMYAINIYARYGGMKHLYNFCQKLGSKKNVVVVKPFPITEKCIRNSFFSVLVS